MDLASGVGYGAALLIGGLLGIVGGGGAILTLPVLVYAFRLPPLVATTYSLFIVGATSAFGAAGYARDRMIDYGAALRFALPAFLAIYLVRKAIVPAMPAALSLPGGLWLSKDLLVMAVMALAMATSAYGMLRQPKVANLGSPNRPSLARSVGRGFGVGLLTGFVGAGGGFLLVPALALVEKLPMKRAVATSLFVIAVNSLFGFAGDVLSATPVDWRVLLVFTGLASLGMSVGTRVARRVSDQQVRTFFGWFLVVMAVLILVLETRK